METFDLFAQCRYENIELGNDEIKIQLRSKSQSAICPHCKKESNRRNGHYSRRPYDLPIGGTAVRLELRVQRFFCLSDKCRHRTFAEQFSFVTYQAQRCQRLQDAHANIAVELGGEAGARLAGKLNMPVSAGTLLDDIKQQPLLEVETPRVLGIDDWALKKREQKPLARGIIFEKLDMSLHNRYALLAQGCSMARYSLT